MAEFVSMDPVFKGFLCYSSILVVKVLSMVFLTVQQKFEKKNFNNPEDLPAVKKYFGIDGHWKLDDKDVERIREAHLNDLKNIPMFIFIAFAYILTKPDPDTALNVFKTYTWCRIFYTISIAMKMPKSTNDIAWVIGYLLTFYMALICAWRYEY